MRKYLILLAGVLTTLAVFFGCSDRGTNLTTVDLGELENWGIDPSAGHVFDTTTLILQLRNSTSQLLGSVYFPPGAQALPVKHPMPLLVLLAPANGDRFYYFKAGLFELVRELTASGRIQPMVIYCMANDQTFGGYFYGDSDPAGHYDSVFRSDGLPFNVWPGRDDLLEYLHRFYPATIELASKRGIGGIGQGAYGAFRAVIKNPGVFSSISVADGPLDFDGASGNGGLISLFDEAIAEQESFYYLDPFIDTFLFDTGVVLYDDIWVDTTIIGPDTTFDSTWVDYDTLPFNYHRDFDSSSYMPLSMMFTGGAFAFSPNDDSIRFRLRTSGTTRVIDSVRQYTIGATLDGDGYDSLYTFIGNIVKVDFQSHYIDMDFHLPFDSNGTLYPPIWSRWMRNNLQDMYLAETVPPLTGLNMWFASNSGAEWGYYEMTQSWINFLKSRGYTVEEYKYGSYTDEPVVRDEYLFDILREMLIFHSHSFGD